MLDSLKPSGMERPESQGVDGTSERSQPVRRAGGMDAWLGMLLCLVMLGGMGCTTIRETFPDRTATEQILMSYAGMHAIAQMDLEPMRGLRVWIDESYWQSYDSGFMISEFRAALMSVDADVIDEREQADVIFEIRSAGVGINTKDLVIGLPALPVPVPSIGVVTTPEMALVKQKKRQGLASFAAIAYRRETKELLLLVDPTVGSTKLDSWAFIGIPIVRERQRVPPITEP